MMKIGVMKYMSKYIFELFKKENKRLNANNGINPHIKDKNTLNRKLEALESKSELQWIMEHIGTAKIFI